MKTLAEVFSTNPSLLDEPEVKELIEQFRIQMNALKHGKMDYCDKVTTLTMNSDLFVINGIPCRKVVEQIQALSFK